jgi:hypothetical protein
MADSNDVTPTSGEGEAQAQAQVRASSPKRGLGKWLRHFYWMDEQMEAAVRDGFHSDSPGYAAYERGQAALSAAERLRDAEELADGCLLLLRIGVMQVSRAALVRSGEVADTPPSQLSGADYDLGCAALRAAERLRELDEADRGMALLHQEAAGLFARVQRSAEEPTTPTIAAELSESDRQRLLAAAGVDGASYLATLSAEERRATAKLLERVARKIAAPLRADAARVHRVLLSRWLRIGITIAALLALAVILAPRQPANLALHRPVSTSSTYVAGGVRYDPSGLVDGDRTNMGFHTDRGGSQHVTIDLEAKKEVHSVVVYNRTDCCSEKAVPLRIEMSRDGKKYRTVAERKSNFDVWKATFPPVVARYVRLVDTSGDYFHLAEVEIY